VPEICLWLRYVGRSVSRSRRLWRRRSSAVPRFLVGLDLEAVHQLVVAREEIDDRHQFDYPFIVQPVSPHRGDVDAQSVVAGIHR
jgi:hypothetical protein